MKWHNFSEKISYLSNIESSNIYYLDFDKQVLIDTGHTLEIEENFALLSKKIDLTKIDYMLLTHSHVDHVGGCNYLQKHFPQIQIIASTLQPDFLAHREEFAFLKGSTDNFEPWIVNRYVSNGDIITLDSENALTVVNTPGHTFDSISFYLPNQKILFSGDAIYEKKVSQLDYYQDINLSIEQMLQTLSSLSQLEIDCILPGHGRVQTDVKQNLQILSRKCRKFKADIGLAIVNYLIPSVEHYIYDHPHITKTKVHSYYLSVLEFLNKKSILQVKDEDVYFNAIINKVFLMMDFLHIIKYDETTDELSLSGQINSYLIN